jgi:hypothetical protein
MTNEILQEAIGQIQIGEVYEVQITRDGDLVRMGRRPLEDFMHEWDHALVGQHPDRFEPFDRDDLPPFSWDRAYIGVVHEGGAYLREVLP